MTRSELEADASSRSKWTSQRIARLGFLVGCGLPAKMVAADPEIASNPNNVARQAFRFGLKFREAPKAGLPADVAERFAAAAAARGTTYTSLINAVLIAVGSDSTLIDNILDDGVTT